jgi:hypothetical protein
MRGDTSADRGSSFVLHHAPIHARFTRQERFPNMMSGNQLRGPALLPIDEWPCSRDFSSISLSATGPCQLHCIVRTRCPKSTRAQAPPRRRNASPGRFAPPPLAIAACLTRGCGPRGARTEGKLLRRRRRDPRSACCAGSSSASRRHGGAPRPSGPLVLIFFSPQRGAASRAAPAASSYPWALAPPALQRWAFPVGRYRPGRGCGPRHRPPPNAPLHGALRFKQHPASELSSISLAPRRISCWPPKACCLWTSGDRRWLPPPRAPETSKAYRMPRRSVSRGRRGPCSTPLSDLPLIVVAPSRCASSRLPRSYLPHEAIRRPAQAPLPTLYNLPRVLTVSNQLRGPVLLPIDE